jgi:hypothetical protein
LFPLWNYIAWSHVRPPQLEKPFAFLQYHFRIRGIGSGGFVPVFIQTFVADLSVAILAQGSKLCGYERGGCIFKTAPGVLQNCTSRL